VTVASAIYAGTVVHERLRPRRHRLRYRVFSLYLDLDELADLDRRLRLFGHNRAAVFAFHDRDHGDATPGGLRRWAEARLADAGLAPDGGPIRVLCYPRIFGYVFNPLTVFYCHRRDGSLAAILYEVNNTHGEKHTYVIPVVGDDDVVRQSCRKSFFVSPFVGMACVYRFRLTRPAESALVSIVETDSAGVLLSAVFSGHRQPLTDRRLMMMLVAYPLMTLKVMAGIHFEALRLYLKGVPIVPYRRAARQIDSTAVAGVPLEGERP